MSQKKVSKKRLAKSKIKEIKKLGLDEKELRDLGNELMDKAILEITFQDLFDIIDKVVQSTIKHLPQSRYACEERY